MTPVVFGLAIIYVVISVGFVFAAYAFAGRPVARPLGGAPRVLFIDDNADLLAVVRLAMEAEVCQVQIAEQPRQGLEFYRKNWRNIDVVLLDFLMPDMNGDQVFQSIATINPNASTILVTGYGDAQELAPLQKKVTGCLLKPFSMDELVRMVQAAADHLKQPAFLLC